MSVLPNVEWQDFSGEAEDAKMLFILTGNRVMFMGGIHFPVSSSEPSSYEFLKRFASDAPFRMNRKNFRVRMLGKSSRWAWQRPEGEIAERLQAVLV